MIKVEKVKKPSKDKKTTVCLANGMKVSKFEMFKDGSQFLKEPLASELANNSDHFTNDAVQLLKIQGSYQQDNRENRKQGNKDWQMMLRLRSPGGEITGKLFLALDKLSNELGNGTLRATTRRSPSGVRYLAWHEVRNINAIGNIRTFFIFNPFLI